MTAKASDTWRLVLNGITTLCWFACAALYADNKDRLQRIEDKLDAVTRTEDSEHATFKANELTMGQQIKENSWRIRSLVAGAHPMSFRNDHDEN
jgi:hypothetical protein